MFKRGDWSGDLARTVGNPDPNQDIINFISGWSTSETNANSGARFNLLNTTESAADATDFNSVHVRNYTSYQEGLAETAATLANGRYPALLEAIKTNDVSALAGPSPEILAELKTWSGGDGYGAGFIALGAEHLNDQFDYGSAPAEEVPVLQNYSPQSTDFNTYFEVIDDNHWQCKRTNCVIQYAIKSFFQTLSIDGQTLPVIGLPTSNEVYTKVNGRTIVIQFYERGIAVYDPGHALDSQPGTGDTYLAKYDDPVIAGIDPARK